MQWLGGDAIVTLTVAAGLAFAGFLGWLVRTVLDIRENLNSNYMTRTETYDFIERILGPTNRRLDVLHDDVQTGFRRVYDKLDKKADRHNGTG